MIRVCLVLTLSLISSNILAFSANTVIPSSKIYPKGQAQNDSFYLVDNPEKYVSNVYVIHEKNLSKASVNQDIWSGYHWPLNTGQVGNRYWGQKDQWKNYKKIFDKEPSEFLSHKTNFNDLLSPGEKYDLLVGDRNFSLTNASWKEGRYYQMRLGKVPTWYGLCDGWASASYMEDRPRNYIDVKSGDATRMIRFYPEDIKALLSLLWAKSRPKFRMVGKRCDVRNPKSREKYPECYDVNPASFYLALVNQVGISKRSFMFDATTDKQVWNAPIVSYDFTYYNRITKQETKNLEEALIQYRDFYKNDPQRKYRSKKTYFLLGVKLVLINKKLLTHIRTEADNFQFDKHTTKKYNFDLEIDRSGNVVGGEWISKKHPDFIWGYKKNAKAMAYYDKYIDIRDWKSPKEVLDFNTRTMAINSSKKGVPSAKIIRKLLEWSNK